MACLASFSAAASNFDESTDGDASGGGDSKPLELDDLLGGGLPHALTHLQRTFAPPGPRDAAPVWAAWLGAEGASGDSAGASS
jgi:hypothetical protein